MKLSQNLIFYFGEKDLDPIQQNNETGRWECFINIDDKSNCWHEIEQKEIKILFGYLKVGTHKRRD